MKRELPKNVRQIGNVSSSPKIYVEDYVDTFFNQLCDKAEESPTGAFLVGEMLREEEQDCVFVYGAIRMNEVDIKGRDVQIGDGVWKSACETCKEYFGDAEILGWMLAVPEASSEMNFNMKKTHEKFFKREKSIFVLKNAADREEEFYIHKYQDLMECGGHYIYYEKNPEMQNYMISSRRDNGVTPSETIEDRAAKNFRSVIREKMERGDERRGQAFLYAASTFLVLVVFVIGVTMINNYDKMQGVQESLDTISQSVSNKKEEEAKETEQKSVKDAPEKVETAESKKEEAFKEEQKEQEDIYIVEKGDTLVTISKKIYGDSSHVEAICKMNGLEDGNIIFIGQKLLLP